MISNVVLIGPIRAGKSTVGELLSQRLGVPQVSMDDVCRSFYEEMLPDGVKSVLPGPDGFTPSSLVLHALERILQVHQGCVIDLGGGHSYFPDDAALERARTILDSYPNVFLLLPSQDLQESAETLAKRNVGNPWIKEFVLKNGVNPNEQFLKHKSNFVLAKHIIYTKGKSPLETCQDILDRIESVATTTDISIERKGEIVEMLSETLEKARQGWIRSIVIIAVQHDDGGGCWARVRSEDTRVTCEYMDRLEQDLR